MIQNIVITHGYSDSNKGDLAITQATVEALVKRFPSAEITLMSTFRIKDKDFWYHNRKMKENGITIIQGVMPTPYMGGNSSFILNILAVLRMFKDYLQLQTSLALPFIGNMLGGKSNVAIKAFKKADLVVIKGGQFIYNDKEDLRGNIFLWRTLEPIKVAAKLQKKIVVLGQSIGGFASDKSEKYAMKHLELCDKIIVREQLSYDLLRSYGLNHIEKKPDMAFNINSKPINKFFAIDKEFIGITVVNWAFPSSEDPNKSMQNYVENLIFGIKKAYIEFNLFPLFIPQVTVKHHGKSDLDLIRIIVKKLDEINIPSQTITEDYNAAEMVSVYSKCKLLIGTRLHSCILAAVAGTPIIAIKYQGYKTQGVMEMLENGKYVHNIYDLIGQELFSHIREINANHKKIRDGIIIKVNSMKNDIEKVINSL